MPAIRLAVCSVFLSLLVAIAAAQPAPLPTLRVSSRLVFLDTTVVDKQGHVVTSGLTQDDFLITQDKQPQRIFSFDPPQPPQPDRDQPNAPVTIFVVDQLNGTFQDFDFIRRSLHSYLDKQPAELDTPCELMLLGFHSLQLVQSFTRSKSELLEALARIPPALPIGISVSERFTESVYALQLVALQNRGVPGRKNLIWIGFGAPTVARLGQSPGSILKFDRFMHATTNLLVDARVSLFLIYPGIRPYIGEFAKVRGAPGLGDTAESDGMALAISGTGSPFRGDIHFGSFASATGGGFAYRNDVDLQIDHARALGSGYFTLTYQPPQGPMDGAFRNIRVTMRNPELRAITKAGYFAPDHADSDNPHLHLMENLIVSTSSTIPLHGLSLHIEDILWRPDTSTTQFTVLVDEPHLAWHSQDDGTSLAHLFFAVTSLDQRQQALTSTYEPVTVTVPTQDVNNPKTRIVSRVPVTFRVPLKAADLRFVIETEDGDKLGSGDISRNLIDTAPQRPTAEPTLLQRRHP